MVYLSITRLVRSSLVTLVDSSIVANSYKDAHKFPILLKFLNIFFISLFCCVSFFINESIRRRDKNVCHSFNIIFSNIYFKCNLIFSFNFDNCGIGKRLRSKIGYCYKFNLFVSCFVSYFLIAHWLNSIKYSER